MLALMIFYTPTQLSTHSQHTAGCDRLICSAPITRSYCVIITVTNRRLNGDITIGWLAQSHNP